MPILSQVPFIGEIASLGAALIWAFSMVLYTGPAAKLSPNGINLFKNLVALGFLILLIVFLPPVWPSDYTHLGALALSGLIGITLGDSAFFAALRYLGAQMTSAVQCLAPPFAAVLAMMFYGETLSTQQTLGLLLTSCAVFGMVLARSHSGEQKGGGIGFFLNSPGMTIGLGWAVLAAFCQALGIVLARNALQGMDTSVGTLFRLIPAVGGLVAISLVSSRFQDLKPILTDRKLAQRLSFAAFLGTFLGLILMSIGAKFAKAGVTTALSSTYPLWVIPLARIYLKEPGNLRSYAWTLVATAGIIVMLQES